ncbi:MAG: flagellar hook-length control protein FliK [Victivallales bacterium]|nr:flagellar hook-length control protein FliK [Victivallales bacterium]
MNLIDSLRGYDNASQSNALPGTERESVQGNTKDSAFSSALIKENNGGVADEKGKHGKDGQGNTLMSIAGILVADECVGELNPLDLSGTGGFFVGEDMPDGELESFNLYAFEKIDEQIKSVSEVREDVVSQALQGTTPVAVPEDKVSASPLVVPQTTLSSETSGMGKSFAAQSQSAPVGDNPESALHGVQEMFIQTKPEMVSDAITVRADQAASETDGGFRQVSTGQGRHESIDAYKMENTDGIKILDVKYDKKGRQDSGAGAKQESGGLLKSLAGKISAGMQRLQSQPQSGAADVSLKVMTSAAIAAQTMKTAPQTGNIQNTDNVQNIVFGNNMDLSQSVNNISATNTGASPELGGGAIPDKVEAVQQIIYKLQDMLPLQDTGRGNRISVSFEVANLGKMQMFLEQKENSLKVVIESDTNSGRQELMSQREGMTQQLRAMGYKDVTLDFSSSNSEHKFAQQQEKNSPTGNEDIDNVKLAGSDKLDLEAILAMK